jgi:tetratricopeptide (TPR) repeat protein/tRNA A-37 threonylcarbamoyl transferase component Bud32
MTRAQTRRLQCAPMGSERREDTPQTLGRYGILRRLGAGGMAEVFLAKSTGAEGIEKILVVKRVLPSFARSVKFIAMFLEEAKIATRLNHPNIVQVYAFEQVRDEFLLAMEFVDGLDLGRLVNAARRKGARIPYDIAAYLAMEVAKGLDYAHKRKDERGEAMEIVHRDVSPQNVLLSYEGVVKVADFGIAKARMVSEETGVIKGKFSYMSPEQARGDRVDARSDVYSLGVLLAELLMNRAMYPGQQGLDVLEEVRHGRITAPETVDPQIPDELARIVRRATAFDREERFQSARSLSGAIGQYLHQEDDVVDGETLERFIANMVPREETSPDAAQNALGGTAATVASAVAGADQEDRERRHVVVVAGRVEVAGGTGGVDAVGDEGRRVLADIAYKADAVLSWPDGTEGTRFRFILGLRRASVHDPLRAMQVAMDVVEALSGLSADLFLPIRASLGVSRGVVSTVRDRSGRLLRYEPVGSVLEVADGLASGGAPEEILVAGEVYRLVRRGFAFEGDAARDVQMGERSALRAYRLRGARTREERAADARAAPLLGIVGRDEELRLLTEAYQEAVRESRNAYLVVLGELGVGKTALIAAALETFEPKPKILHAECAFGSVDQPYSAVTDLVRDAIDLREEAGPEEARSRLVTFAERFVPRGAARDELIEGLIPLLAPADAEEGAVMSRSGLVRRSAKTLLWALARRGPVIVWVDALQWADNPSLELLSALMRDQYEIPLLAVLGSRPEPRIDHLLSGIPAIELGDLDEAARRAFVRQRFRGASVPPDVEDAVVDRSGGNPFFIVELVEALIDRGVVKVVESGDQRRVVRQPGIPMALPTTLEGVIAARLDELPELERLAIRWLAVSGPGYSAVDLSQLAGVDLVPALQTSERRGLVARVGNDSYGFPNAVTRHVAYETTDVDDRVRMHQRVGRWLTRSGLPVPPARIARHLEQAGDRTNAAEAYLQAAASARNVYSNREALRFYGKALALLPAGSERTFAAHEAREQILRGLSRPAEQGRELFAMRALADQSGDARQMAVAYSRLARFELEALRVTGVRELLQKAFDAAAQAGEKSLEADCLRLEALLAQETGDAEAALLANDRALERCGVDAEVYAVRGAVLVQRALLLRRLGRLEEALGPNTEAIVIFRRLGLKGEEADALNSLGVALASLGEYEDSGTCIRASIALDRQTGDRMHLARKLSNVGQLALELGDKAGALAFLERADHVFERISDDTYRADALCGLTEVLLETGAGTDQAAAELDRARRVAERTGDRYDLARERIVRASLEREMGRLERAELAAKEGVDIASEAGVVMYEVQARALRAELLALLGRIDEARGPIECRPISTRARSIAPSGFASRSAARMPRSATRRARARPMRQRACWSSSASIASELPPFASVMHSLAS